MYNKCDQDEVGGDESCQLLFKSVVEESKQIDKIDYNDGDLKLSLLSYKEYLEREVGVKYGSKLMGCPRYT